jgi:hypothetical protein
MSKSDDRKLEALARKNAAKATKERTQKRQRYDETLSPEAEQSLDTRHFFDEMKKRDF